MSNVKCQMSKRIAVSLFANCIAIDHFPQMLYLVNIHPKCYTGATEIISVSDIKKSEHWSLKEAAVNTARVSSEKLLLV